MTPHEIFDVLYKHLGMGRLDDDAHARLSRIDPYIPDHLRGQGGKLWRAMTLPVASLVALEEGRSVNLEPRPYACWSRDKLAIMALLRVRGGQLVEGEAIVLLSKDVAPSDCMLDVEAFFLSTGAQTCGITWSVYAGREHEIILREPARPGIEPDHIVQGWRHGDLDIWTPLVGETFCAGEDDLVIEAVLGPEESTGCMMVAAAGRRHRIVPESFGWMYGGESDDLDEMASKLDC